MNQQHTSVEQSIKEQFPLWARAPLVTPQAFAGRYIVVGCGSSFYIAQSVAAALNRRGQPALAVAGNEWASHSGAYVMPAEQLRLIAVSRSGESTETVLALREAQKNGIHVTGITCEQKSTLAQEADTVIYAETHPREGVVMTASASLMLLEGFRFAGVEIEGEAVATTSEELLQGHAGDLAQAVQGRSHFVVLGAAELHGLAQEGALKMQEMSLSYSQAYHPMEYRHGPMSLVDEQTLIVLLYHPDTAHEEAKVARDMQAKGARVIGIGGPGDLSIALDDPDAARRGLLALPLLQWLGQLVAEQKGVDSEHPRHLTKVVSLT